MNKKNILKKTINVLFVISWLTIIGTIIASFLLKDSLSIYDLESICELGFYMTIIGKIQLICLIFIFIKSVTSEYFK